MPDDSRHDSLRKASLDYHEYPKPGKLEIRATKPLANGRDLARAYSPGVAEAFAAASVVSSWVLDLPAAEKNSANKFFDGLASGRTIAINYGGWQERLLEESGAGFRMSRDLDRAAEQMTEWLADPGRIEVASQAARTLGAEQFSRDKLAHQLDGVLREAVAAAR